MKGCRRERKRQTGRQADTVREREREGERGVFFHMTDI